MNKTLPIVEVPPSGNKNWYGGAFVLAFVISKRGNFLVKGYRSDVKEFIRENYTHYLVKYTLWHRGEHRTIWEFWKPDVSVFQIFETKGRRGKRSVVKKRFYIYKRLNGSFRKDPNEFLDLRRPLNRWIPELEKF